LIHFVVSGSNLLNDLKINALGMTLALQLMKQNMNIDQPDILK